MKPPTEPHGLMLHYFHGGAHKPTQGSLSADDFRRLLDEYGHRMIDAALWHDLAVGNVLADQVCVTLDDGLREAIDVALPVLEERGLTAAWNVPTLPLVGVPLAQEVYRWVRNQFATMGDFYNAAGGAYVIPPEYLAHIAYLSPRDRAFRYIRDEVLSAAEYERLMDFIARANGLTCPITTDHWLRSSDLWELREAGHVIGLHTHTHPTNITGLSREQQAAEYATSAWILKTIIGEPVTTMSHPNGRVTDFGLDWMRANGITLAWGATMTGSWPYMVPRWSSGNWSQ